MEPNQRLQSMPQAIRDISSELKTVSINSEKDIEILHTAQNALRLPKFAYNSNKNTKRLKNTLIAQRVSKKFEKFKYHKETHVMKNTKEKLSSNKSLSNFESKRKIVIPNSSSLTNCGSKLVHSTSEGKSYTIHSDLINLYCSKCKKESENYKMTNCQNCFTALLYQCTNCTCLYKNLEAIQSHIKCQCYNEFFFCPKCNYKTSCEIELIIHTKSEHQSTNIPKYLCGICRKKFKIQKNMLAHQKVCRIQPFLKCPHCEFKTKSNRGISLHVQLMHQQFIDQNYHKCPDCGRKYKTLYGLNTHIQSSCVKDQKFECSECKFKINRKYALLKHIQLYHPQLVATKMGSISFV